MPATRRQVYGKLRPLVEHTVEAIPLDCAAKICATGITDVFDESTRSPPKSERAMREGILNPTTDETGRVKRLVELSIRYTRPRDEVGGPIDVLELWNNGRIRWVSRKSNCPENPQRSPKSGHVGSAENRP